MKAASSSTSRKSALQKVGEEKAELHAQQSSPRMRPHHGFIRCGAITFCPKVRYRMKKKVVGIEEDEEVEASGVSASRKPLPPDAQHPCK